MNEVTARHRLSDAIQNLIKVHMNWDDEKSRHWMTTENPNLGGAAPVKFVMNGRSHKLLAFIESAISESRIGND